MVCWRIERIHAALSLASFLREKASKFPAGFYRINTIEEARKAIERARVFRVNTIFPDSL